MSGSSRILLLAIALASLVLAPSLALGAAPSEWTKAENPRHPLEPRQLDAAYGRVFEPPMNITVGSGANAFSLHARIYRPIDSSSRPIEPVPLIAHFSYTSTPATDTDPDIDKPLFEGNGRLKEFVERGYAAAFIDLPGTGSSGGCFDFMGQTTQDAVYAAIETLGQLPWTTGRVGVFGASYTGAVAMMAGALHPPHLAAIVGAEGFGSMYDFAYQGGVRFGETDLAQDNGNGGLVHSLAFVAAFPGVHLCPETSDLAQAFLVHPDYDAFWSVRDATARAANLARPDPATGTEVSPLIIGSWRDTLFKSSQYTQYFSAVPVDDRSTIADEGVPFKMLVIDKAHHGGIDDGTRDGLMRLVHSWFDEFLYGATTHVRDQDAVWSIGNDGTISSSFATLTTASQWPPAGTRAARLYLGPSDQLMSKRPGPTAQMVATFQDTGATTEGEMLAAMNLSAPHPDFLWFETAPLEQDVRIAGEPILHAAFASSERSTHLAVALFDMGVVDDVYDRSSPPCQYATGGALPSPRISPENANRSVNDQGIWLAGRTACTISRGFLDARHSSDLSSGQDLIPGQPFPADIRMLAQDWTVAAGHRIAIGVSSSNAFWAVPDTTRATNSLISSGAAPGFLELPVVHPRP